MWGHTWALTPLRKLKVWLAWDLPLSEGGEELTCTGHSCAGPAELCPGHRVTLVQPADQCRAGGKRDPESLRTAAWKYQLFRGLAGRGQCGVMVKNLGIGTLCHKFTDLEQVASHLTGSHFLIYKDACLEGLHEDQVRSFLKKVSTALGAQEMPKTKRNTRSYLVKVGFQGSCGNTAKTGRSSGAKQAWIRC